MDKEEKINVELGGMEIYGTTSNKEIVGYKTSGDIENAGKIEKGFKRPKNSVNLRQIDESNKE